MKHLIIMLMLSKSFFATAGSGIFGKITNADAHPISNALVTIYDSNFNKLTAIFTNANGDYGFNLPMASNYIMQIINATDTTQFLTGIAVENIKPTVLNFAMSNSITTAKKSLIGNKYIKTSKEIERMPSTDINSVAISTGAFKSDDVNGGIRTVGLPSSNVQYIIDGQIVPTGGTVRFTPGSVSSVEVLKK
jgi:Carboxypeptidase regulatory-like domain